MDSTVSSSKDPEQVLSLCQDNYTSLQCHQTHVRLWKEKKINIYAYSMKEMVKEWLMINSNCNIKQLFVWKKCGLIIFFLLKILAKQFILKNNETVENLHKMYIDSGLFFQWIHLPITTQHINHLCVSDAFFKGTFHKYKPTNKFFWTCIVKIDNHSTSYLASAQCEDNINMNTISWSVILTLLYKKPPKELRSENIQISSQIWQSTGKRIFFFS